MVGGLGHQTFDRNLIFDLGLHRGLDSKFYLDKGFRVVAIEANPRMASLAKASLETHLSNGNCTIVEKAFWSKAGETISFYVNTIKDDWSSAFKGWAEKEGHATEEIRVETTTLDELVDHYGLPYYIKCDVEGADIIFAQQIARLQRIPPFVSVEAVSLDILAILISAGYDRVQIVNQAFNGRTKSPNPPLEGEFVDVVFNGHMSGLFGLELPSERWVTFAEAASRYLKFRDLRSQDPLLAHGWLDFHVTTDAFLKSR